MEKKTGKILILLLIIILFSLSFVDAVDLTNATSTEEIGQGLFYNVRSSIFKWFQKTIESVKSIFAENVNSYENESKSNSDYYEQKDKNIENSYLNETVESVKSTFAENIKIYENESKKYSEYYRQRNENIENSYHSGTEPPFDSTICAQSAQIGADEKFTFCSCGDEICASYEDKCNCQKDCGNCPENTICKRGKCMEYIENTCMNTICEERENETCPWDCKIYMQEEQEKVLSEEEKTQIAERVRRNRIDFLRSNGMSQEEIDKALLDAENKIQQVTLPEEPGD